MHKSNLGSINFIGESRALLQWPSMYAYHTSSSSSCIGCSVQKCCTFTHAGGSRSVFVAPISDCGDFIVLRTTKTEQNVGKRFWGCPKYKVKFIQLFLMQT